MLSVKLSKIYLILFYFIAFIVIFKSTISEIFGGNVGNILLLIIYVPVLCYFFELLRFGIDGYKGIIILVYIIYCLILVAIFPLNSNTGDYVTASIGFSNLVCLLILFYILSMHFGSDIMKNRIGFFFVLLGLFNAIGAIIQYYVSIDMFGLIYHPIYTNLEIMSNESVNNRAISFISSPQSLSLFLAFSFAYTFSVRINLKLLYIIRFLLIYAGILTESKAFFVFLFVYVVFAYMSFKHIFKLLFGLLFLLLMILVFNDQLGRTAEIFKILNNINSYSAFVIWSDSLEYALHIPEVFLGHGIGLFSRGGQSLGGYVVLYGSTESFLIQMLIEIGAIGVALFSLIYCIALNRSYKYDRKLFGMLISFLVLAIFTPSIYGFSSGIVFYFVLMQCFTLSSRAKA